MRRVAALLFLTLLFFLAHPPASLMDIAFARLSGGKLRLAAAEGSLWNGSAILATHDGQRTLRAWRPIEWRLRLAPIDGAVIIEILEHDRPQLAVTMTLLGLRVDTLNIDLPAAVIVSGISHPLAKAGWHGDLLLNSRGLVCGWDGSCEGALRAEWSSAALDILPGRALGDHEFTLHALNGEFESSVTTLQGDIRLAGSGRLDRQGNFSFEGSIEGDEEIVDRIPAVMDRNAFPTGQSGRVRIVLP